MTLTVESSNKRIEVFHDTSICNNVALLEVPGSHDVIQRVVVKHSDIDSIIEALQLYKERRTEVLGADALK